MNSLFGKQIENNVNRSSVRFLLSGDTADRSFKDPTFKSAVVCSPDLALAFHQQTEAKYV